MLGLSKRDKKELEEIQAFKHKVEMSYPNEEVFYWRFIDSYNLSKPSTPIGNKLIDWEYLESLPEKELFHVSACVMSRVFTLTRELGLLALPENNPGTICPIVVFINAALADPLHNIPRHLYGQKTTELVGELLYLLEVVKGLMGAGEIILKATFHSPGAHTVISSIEGIHQVLTGKRKFNNY